MSTKSLISALKTLPGRRGGGWGYVMKKIELCPSQAKPSQAVKRPICEDSHLIDDIFKELEYRQGFVRAVGGVWSPGRPANKQS